jgi:hypothetical protein
MPWSNARPRSASYGTAHVKARREAAARHHPEDPCTRCGHPLGPMGRWLHYDHSADRTHYLGFAHARCNVRAGARAGRARQNVTNLRW